MWFSKGVIPVATVAPPPQPTLGHPRSSSGSLRAVALGGAANLLLWDLPPPPPAQGAQQQQQQNGPRQGPDGSGPGAGLVGSQGGVLKWISKQEPQSQGQGQGAGEQGQGAGEQGQKAGEQGPRRTRGAQRDQEREEAEDERARQTLQTVVRGCIVPARRAGALGPVAFCRVSGNPLFPTKLPSPRQLTRLRCVTRSYKGPVPHPPRSPQPTRLRCVTLCN